MLLADVPDNGALENVSDILEALSEVLALGVQPFFHRALVAPTRCANIRSFGRHPFAAPQRNGGLAKAKVLHAALDFRQPRASTSVGVPLLVLGIAAAQLGVLIDSGVQTLVLECFGSGTGPSDNPLFLASLKRAQD